MCKSSKTLPLCVAYMPVATPVAVSMLHPCGYPDMPVVTMVLIRSNWKQAQLPRLGHKGKSKVQSRGKSTGCTVYAGTDITNASILMPPVGSVVSYMHACNSTDGYAYCCTDHLVDLFRSLQGSPLNEHCQTHA